MLQNLVSIIIPCYNEEKYIRECLNSVLEFNYPKDKLEIFVVDGMSDDNTRGIVQNEYCNHYENIKLIDNPDKTAPFAFNAGIKISNGDFIIIIGAHSSYSKDYIKNLVDWHSKLDAFNIGGVMNTDVRHRNRKTNAIIKVLSNKFGVGNADFRTGTDKVLEVDTVAYGCYRKDSFEKFGLFNEKLTRNQDIEFNKRIINGGGKIYLVPDAPCNYFARETFSGIAKNNFQNGMWNILTIYFTKDLASLSLRHFIPLAFVLSIILPAIASIFWWPLIILSGLSFMAYTSLIFFISLRIKDKDTGFFHLIYTFLVLHISYGTGSLAGIIRLPIVAFNNKK